MDLIRVLDDDLVNQIAAGEVVERPASVVKELVENSLDAEAQDIRVSIVEGGVRSISVIDDGVGMSREDARRAFLRHATSKIRDAGDLAGVGSLGFRGEALPSIASVAAVRMCTRCQSDAVGTELSGEGGAGIERVGDIACPPGTRVEVRELFGRVPARLKFLKSPATESAHVTRLIERIALGRPDVRFSLERDGRQVLLLPPTASARERAVAILPPSVGERMVQVDRAESGARVIGLASPTDVMRGSADGIHLFVNGRPVRDRLLLFAVREAYRDALPSGRHPLAVLFVHLPVADVDVNVHPAKTEVRFRDPRSVAQLVRRGLRNAIGARALIPAGADPARPPGRDGPDPAAHAPTWFQDGSTQFAEAPLFSTARDGPATREGRDPTVFRSLRYIGQALGGYLLCEGGDRLVVLDPHAAHERVLFDRLRAQADSRGAERQSLLVPIRVELERSAADALLADVSQLERAGFEIEGARPDARGRVRMVLRGVPALLSERPVDWQAMLEQTAATFRDPTQSETRDGLDAQLHDIAATAACHAAARLGDRLETREVDALLEALDASVWFPNCPHGRPVVATLSRAELERRFLRR